MKSAAVNISFLATCRDAGAQGDIHGIERAALVWENDRIVWVGPESVLPIARTELQIMDLGGLVVIPGLVDCHTHLAFAGWRADEFEKRIRGATYLEIAQAGGGILSTVRRTREALLESLVSQGKKFLAEMSALGITTVECKSGYGLDTETEIKILQAYRELSDLQPLSLVSTFLGAHTFPTEFRERKDDYVSLVIEEMLPRVAAQQLAEFCDIFVEQSGFSLEQARRIFAVAKKLGLRPKLHADQLSAGRAAQLAAEVGAISADHLEFTDDDGIAAMNEAGVIAVTLPLASLYTQQRPLDARRFVAAGVPVAVATDFNPGSAPSYDLPLAMMLACNMNRLTPPQALKGATIYAARAIAREHIVGSLEKGKLADFAVLDVPDINHWLYHFRPNCCEMTVKGGAVVSRR